MQEQEQRRDLELIQSAPTSAPGVLTVEERVLALEFRVNALEMALRALQVTQRRPRRLKEEMQARDIEL